MIRRRLWISLVGIVLIAVVGLVVTVATGTQPAFGLDLDGGVSVVLATEQGATSRDLAETRDLIRDDLQARGIAEADVRVDGLNIVVDLPNVDDQSEVVDVVQASGFVTLRAVLEPCQVTVDVTESSVPSESTVVESTQPSTASTSPDSTEPGTDSTAAAETSEPADAVADSTSPDATEGRAGFRRAAASDTTTAASTEPATSTATTEAVGASTETSEPTASSDTTESSEPTDSTEPTESTEPPVGPLGPIPTYPPPEFGPPPASPEDSPAELPGREESTCFVGPAQRGFDGQLGGQVFDPGSAEVINNQGVWVVFAETTDVGADVLGQIVNTCRTAAGQEACPLGMFAIVLDGLVVFESSAEVTSTAEAIPVYVSQSRSEAQAVADLLNRGTLPVGVELVTVQSLSAGLGDDSLRTVAAIGIVGLGLVLAALAYVYRRLVVVAIAGLAVSATLVYTAAAIASEVSNAAVSMAGVVGIFVAGAIAVDSYVVYFERLKEEVRHGRTMRNAALRSFKASWRAIVTADLVALVASISLYAIGEGAVQTFALYLGVATLAGALISFLFTRPAVGLLADRGWLDRGDTFRLKEYSRT